MYPANPPICLECKRLDWKAKDKVKCEAFPDGVPMKIWEEAYDHRFPFKGDNGILFASKEE